MLPDTISTISNSSVYRLALSDGFSHEKKEAKEISDFIISILMN